MVISSKNYVETELDKRADITVVKEVTLNVSHQGKGIIIPLLIKGVLGQTDTKINNIFGHLSIISDTFDSTPCFISDYHNIVLGTTTNVNDVANRQAFLQTILESGHRLGQCLVQYNTKNDDGWWGWKIPYDAKGTESAVIKFTGSYKFDGMSIDDFLEPIIYTDDSGALIPDDTIPQDIKPSTITPFVNTSTTKIFGDLEVYGTTWYNVNNYTFGTNQVYNPDNGKFTFCNGEHYKFEIHVKDQEVRMTPYYFYNPDNPDNPDPNNPDPNFVGEKKGIVFKDGEVYVGENPIPTTLDINKLVETKFLSSTEKIQKLKSIVEIQQEQINKLINLK